MSLTGSDFSQGDPPTPVPGLDGGNAIPVQAASPLKVTAQAIDGSVSPLSEPPPLSHKDSGEAVPEVAEISVVPTRTIEAPAEVMPLAPADLVELPLDPALFDTQPVRGLSTSTSPKMQQRAMPPAMHRLNTNVSANSSFSTPSSVMSSPETPFGVGVKYGLYANMQGQESYDDLSRVGSRAHLRTQHGTDMSASSEDDAVDADHEGGVPAPKAKKSHARKVSHCCRMVWSITDLSSNRRTISSEREMLSSYSGSISPILA
jgi:hypothetical protein